MAIYKLPLLERFEEISSEINHLYKNTSENPQRKFFINFYVDLLEKQNIPSVKKRRELLFGWTIFMLEYIEQVEYSGRSPSKGWFWGSNFYPTLLKLFKISSANPIQDDVRLLYLDKILQHVQTNVSEYSLKKYGRCKEQLIKDIQARMNHVIYRDNTRINALTHRLPDFNIIENNIKNMYTEYEVASKKKSFLYSWFESHSRKEMIEFMQIIHTSCHEYYKDDDKTFVLSANAQLGSLLLALIDINSEYSIFTPGSELFKLCLKALNAESLDSINPDKKRNWLRALATHILLIVSSSYKDKLTQEQLIILGKFQKKLDKYIVIQENEREKLSTIAWIFNSSTAYAIQGGVTFLTGKLLERCAFMAMSSYAGGLIAGGLAGPLGYVSYTAAGGLVCAFYSVYGDKLPNVSTLVYTKLLEVIGKKVTSSTNNAVTYTVHATYDGLKKIWQNDSLLSEADREFFQDWVAVLLRSPDTAISKKEKEKIQSLFAITPVELDELPLSTLRIR